MNKKLKRKTLNRFLILGTFIFAGTMMAVGSNKIEADTSLPMVTVYKTASCGCCKKWVNHLTKNGFVVQSNDVNDLSSIKKELGIEPKFRSCHTAKIGNYFVEGHVPAEDIKKMLSETPLIRGLAVPGMPMGSPGMEGSRKDNFDVLAVRSDGSNSVYNSH